MSAKHRRRSSRRSSILSRAVLAAVLVGFLTWAMSVPAVGAGGITGIREATRTRPTVQAAARVPADADNIPGIPFGQSPVEGQASAVDDRYDVYAISLAGRQECVFSVRRTSGDGLFVLSLYAPGSTNIFESPQLPVEPDPLNTGGLSYTVPTAGSGIYYLVVRTLSGAGDYRICGPEADDNIPGVGIRSTRSGTVQDSLSSSGDLADVFFVDLVAGRQTRFALSRSQGDIEASVSLFGPNQDDIWYVGADPLKGPLAHAVAWAQPPQSFVYTPTTTGRYYVAVRQYSGSGWYRLAWGDPDDMIPGVPQATNVTPYELHESVDITSDPMDVFAVPLVAGDWYGFRAESELGAQAAPQLLLYSRWAVHVDGETALAQSGTGSVANFVSFTPTATGTYYLAVKGTTGSGNYRLTTPGSPFALNRDAYSFNNFDGFADEQLFRDVFGLGTAALSPKASTYFNTVFRACYGGGVCYGMVMTSGMFYRNVFGPKVTAFQSGAARTRDLGRTTTGGGSNDLDEALERHISKYHYYQYDPAIRKTFFSFSAGNLSSAPLFVDGRLAQGWTDPYAFGWLDTAPKASGHIVNVTGLGPAWLTTVMQLVVYDSNGPNEYRRYDFANSAVVSPNYANLGALTLHPISPHEKSSIPALWGTGAGMSVSMCSASDAQVLQTDSAGRRLGMSGAEVFTEIPGGYRVRALTGGTNPDWSEPLTYYLPKNQDYTVEIAGAGDGPYRYDLFLGDMLAELDSTRTPEGRLRLKTSRASHGYTLSSEGATQAVIARLYREPEPGPDRVIEVSKLALTPGGKLTLASDAGAGAFAILPVGAMPASPINPDPIPTPPTCSIRLISGSGRLRTTTTLAGVALTNGVGHTLTVLNWNNLPRSAIFVSSVVKGKQTVLAYHASTARIAETVDQLVARRLVGTTALGDQIEARMRTSSLSSLRTYLTRLSAKRTVSARTAEMVYAYVRAARGAGR